MRRFALMLTICAAPVAAAADEDWRFLTGPEIRAALEDRVVTYDTARQDFRASGRTLYTFGGRDSWGYWRVQGDQYCSQWPPSDLWDCYDVYWLVDRVLFIGPTGDVTDGRYAD